MNTFLVLGLCLSITVHYASGILCYVCVYNSDVQSSDERCGDLFRLTTLQAVNCDGTCYKRRGYRDQNANVRSLEISRGCYSQTTEYCQDDDDGVTECFCNKDYCNAADTPVPKYTLFIAVSLSVFCLFVKWIC